jgi:glutamate racemase
MRFALINSGLGLLAAASELHRLRPDADLVIAMDPDGMPWGERKPQDIAERSLRLARAAAGFEPDVIVMACNTGSVHALEALRAEFEPDIPVVGTVPAIKPAAALARSVAIWATIATTVSEYQRWLIDEFGGEAEVTPVACPGLATAIDAGDKPAIAVAIAAAALRTPGGCGAVVMGCTEYELAADQISAAVPDAVLFGSAAAVAAQAVRRAVRAGGVSARAGNGRAATDGQSAADGRLAADGRPAAADGQAAADGRLAASGRPAADGHGAADGRAPADGQGRSGTLSVLLSGRRAGLPPAALQYRQGLELAALAAGLDPAARLAV